MTQKELGYVELEWTCKRCGTINPGMQKVCTNCGAPMQKDDKFELPDQQELIKDKEKLDEAKKGPAVECPYCHVLNPSDAKICKQCGGDIQAGLARQAGEVLGAHATGPVPDKPCPFCGQPVKVNAQRCPNCGGSLVEAPKPAAAAEAAKPQKMPTWMIFAGIILGVLCCAGIFAFMAMNSKTSEVTARVSDVSWQRSIDILEEQPVQYGAWMGDVPAGAEGVSCTDRYKETSSSPVANATEVCGTPYVIDQGSGAGKVVQDCEYQVYDQYCEYTLLTWAVVDSNVAEGHDNNPQWPVMGVRASQQEGDRHETYRVVFEGDGQTYTYTPAGIDEFSQFGIGTEWVLAVNSFGEISEVRQK